MNRDSSISDYIGGTEKMHIHQVSKRFGSFWRKPIDQDYVYAKKWALEQVYFLTEANRE